MKHLITRCGNITTTAVLTLWCCLAQADDIEVYVSQASGGSPVALIVMDNSGSMRTEEVVDTPNYDHLTNYKDDHKTKPNGDDIPYQFDTDLYYFDNDYSPAADINSDDVTRLKKRPFPPAALACSKAIETIKTYGSYAQQLKRWDTNKQRWYPRQGSWSNKQIPEGDASDQAALIECKVDEGIHSDGIAAGKFVDTRNRSKYVSSKPSGYTHQWNKHFKYIYHGNYLNYKIYTHYHFVNRTQTRMEITVDAAKHMVNTTDGIRLGLSSFNHNQGGSIDNAVDDIENNRSSLITTLGTYGPVNWTPLTETLYEAAMYLRGDPVKFGSSSVSASRDGSTYKSPIISGCQNISNIVLFTDGDPRYDKDANQHIEDLLDDANINFKTEPGLEAEDREVLTNDCSTDDLNLAPGADGSGPGNGTCGEELAYYLANVDQIKDLPGKQTINTHTIGGFFDETSSGGAKVLKYMEDIAKYGKGSYSAASSKEEIVKSFQNAILVTLDDPVTFVAPAVAANAYNSLEHLDQLYYSMFVPSADNNWQGNLKSYRLSPDGIVVDADGDTAIDNTGLFKTASRSYWTEEGTSDGDNVLEGGAAAKLTKEKNIFTHLSDTKGTLNTRINTTNITKERLGVSSEEHQILIDWINRKQGVDGTRAQMEDPLHSRPVVVNYGYTKDPSTGNVTVNGVVFVGTNSGYLHAFKADKHSFKEYFSFIPKELLANANLYRTADKDQPKVYGVDGPINYWHKDANQNSQVDEGEKAYLFFGLRRGGRHYYALDISDPDSPKFQWKISGGEGDNFDNIGQSWSPMTLAKVRWAGKTKVVLLFGGGYDADEDNRTSRAPNSMGNSIYMIDPESGDLLWSASKTGASMNLPEMTNSITSEIKTVDFDGDQITDYFFVSDIGGRIWRFDINPETTNEGNFIAGAGMLFDANVGNSHYQRFYDAPSVSYFADDTGDKYLTVSIGSGYRAHPLQTDSQDSFYVIKDPYIVKAPTTYERLDRSDLVNIPVGSQLTTAVTTKGWKYDLPTGEKILATPLTAGGNMYFTTFSPSTSAINLNACTADIGSSMAYSVDFKGDDDPKQDPTSPVIKSSPLPNTGITGGVLEIETSVQGQKTFCESNSSHASCQPQDCEETDSCPDDCENTGSVILSGTNTLGRGAGNCDLIKKDYWHSL
jgi:type IV pilus assembly protein PilY1